jgi:hypothetical protein
VANALKAAAKDTITTTDPPKAGWFYHRSGQLFKAIEKNVTSDRLGIIRGGIRRNMQH